MAEVPAEQRTIEFQRSMVQDVPRGMAEPQLCKAVPSETLRPNIDHELAQDVRDASRRRSDN